MFMDEFQTRECGSVEINKFDPRPATENNGIGWAIKQMEHRYAVTRRGWNDTYLKIQFHDPDSKNSPYVYIVLGNGHRVPWVCSQTDLLATDWEIYPK